MKAPAWARVGLRVCWRAGKALGTIEAVSFDGRVTVKWDDVGGATYSSDEASAKLQLAGVTEKQK